MNQSELMEIAMQQSAYDCSCRAEDFQNTKNSLHESAASEKARKYLKLPHICNLVSYGSCIVVCGQKELFPKIRTFVDGVSNISACFETPHLYVLNDILAEYDAKVCFMAEYFLPDLKRLYRVERDCPCEVRILHQEDFAGLYLPAWSNALCRERSHLDVLGAGAYDQGRLIGLAGCSADCDTMWQIGVDVLPEYRRRGIASALTSRLAKEILARDKVPFYCAAWSNIRSVKNAVRSGFVPAWVEATAKPDALIREMTGNRCLSFD